MRKTFIDSLISNADENTYLLVGDLGFSVVESFAEKYPTQFINAGVAEQNMAGMSAGLAISGARVFNYSIANFNTLRAIEQIRNDICYNNLNVTVVSVGGGFVYGSAGYSHHAVQDIAMMSSLPNMTLLLPADAIETKYCMEYIFANQGPTFLRLGKNAEKIFYNDSQNVSEINLISPKEKTDIALISTGTILSVADDIKSLLKESGINVDLYSCPVIDKNFNERVKESFKTYSKIFTIEEHISDNGFGSLVSHALEWEDKKIKSFGANKNLCKVVGGQEYLRRQHGLSADIISDKILKLLNK